MKVPSAASTSTSRCACIVISRASASVQISQGGEFLREHLSDVVYSYPQLHPIQSPIGGQLSAAASLRHRSESRGFGSRVRNASSSSLPMSIKLKFQPPSSIFTDTVFFACASSSHFLQNMTAKCFTALWQRHKVQSLAILPPFTRDFKLSSAECQEFPGWSTLFLRDVSVHQHGIPHRRLFLNSF